MAMSYVILQGLLFVCVRPCVCAGVVSLFLPLSINISPFYQLVWFYLIQIPKHYNPKFWQRSTTKQYKACWRIPEHTSWLWIIVLYLPCIAVLPFPSDCFLSDQINLPSWKQTKKKKKKSYSTLADIAPLDQYCRVGSLRAQSSAPPRSSWPVGPRRSEGNSVVKLQTMTQLLD